MSESTIHANARALRAFFKWATEEAGLPNHPFDKVKMPQLPDEWRVEAFTGDEIAAPFANFREAMQMHIDGTLEDGDSLPSSLCRTCRRGVHRSLRARTL